MTDKKNYARSAVLAAGGQTAVSSATGVTPQAVDQWCKKGQVPAHHVVTLCRMTGGMFQPHMLRPDVFDETQLVQVVAGALIAGGAECTTTSET